MLLQGIVLNPITPTPDSLNSETLNPTVKPNPKPDRV